MGLENLKSVFNDLTLNVKEPVEKISSFEPPQVARVSPDNQSMSPTLQSGKGSQIGDSVFLDATGNSRFSNGEDPNATQPIDFSILDNLPNVARVSPDNQSMSPTLQSGKGSQIGDSIFLDATGISRYSIGVDPLATHSTDFSILDNLPNVAGLEPDNESMSPTLSIGESGIKTRFATISKQGAKPIKLEDLSALDELPNVARVRPDNLSMLPTLQSGKGSQIGDSIFLDATGNSRYEPIIPIEGPIYPLSGFSILDNLPNVARVRPDNLSMSPTLNTGIGLVSIHSHEVDSSLSGFGGLEMGGVEITIHHEFHSALDNITTNQTRRQELRDKSPLIILGVNDVSLEGKRKAFSNETLTLSGIPDVNMAKFGTNLKNIKNKIKKRKFDGTLGKNGRLGEGDFTLGTLFKHNHRGGGTRKVIDTGVLDPSSLTGENIKINTGRAGIGSLSKLDIKGYSSKFRSGIGLEPYIVHNIPQGAQPFTDFVSGVGNDRDLIPFAAALDDVSRLAQFYTSPAGLVFIAKENATNILYGARSNNSISKVTTDVLDKIMAPPIPVPMTGFLNNYHQSIQGGGLGSIRKPFTIQYSDRFNIGIAGNDLGDRTAGLKKALNRLELKEKEYVKTTSEKPINQAGSVAAGAAIKARNIAVAGLKSLRDATVKALNDIPNIPVTQKPTDLLDTSGFGNWSDKSLLPGNARLHGSKDVFANNNKTLDDSVKLESQINLIKEGDFYVRFKDLRLGTSLYFRGYVTGITENISPSWSPTNYIGRSEPVYMYERAERDLSFNLRVYPQNATHQQNIYQNIELLTSLAYPKYVGAVKITEGEAYGENQFRMQPPFTELYMAHIGTRKQGQFGFIKSLSYTVPGEGDWDALNQLPRLFDIAISYQILGKRPPSSTNGSMVHTDTFYGANKG